MHWFRLDPRIRFEADFAQSLRSRWSRFGPMVPFAPAALSVWQLLHPAEPVNTALPAAAEPPEVELEPEVEFDPELELEPELDDPELEPEPEPGLAVPALAGAGETPMGGARLLGCLDSQVLKAAGETTRT